MSIILIIIFLYLFFHSSSDQRKSELGSKMILGGIAAIFLLPLLEVFSEGLAGLLVLGGLGAFIWYLVRTGKMKLGSKRRKKQYGWDPSRWDASKKDPDFLEELKKAAEAWQERMKSEGDRKQQEAYRNNAGGRRTESNYGTSGGNHTNPGSNYKNSGSASPYVSSENTTLPKKSKKRRKIVEAFNDKYELYLTEQQIASIVNSSYMSLAWRRELEAMERRYETIYEWFQGPTAWLRVYMSVFHIQEITSDMQQQEMICMYSFESIFQYADKLEGLPLHVRIDYVNRKFLTCFDDVSFMIAYRFLESKGLNHELKSDILHGKDSVDDLVRKYQTTEE